MGMQVCNPCFRLRNKSCLLLKCHMGKEIRAALFKIQCKKNCYGIGSLHNFKAADVCYMQLRGYRLLKTW